LKFIFFITVFLNVLAGAAQDTLQVRLISKVKGDFIDFSADNLGNIFAITKENQLKKYGPRGDSMGVFNDVRKYGRLTSIDASNPLKILLFYKDFRTIVMLDRLLNMVNVIDLRKQQIFQVRAVAQSYDNNVWIFDEQESRLRKLSEDGRLLSETSELRMVLEEAPIPTTILDRNGFVYMYDPVRGMYIFDYYGALKNRLQLLDWTDIQVNGDEMAGRKEGKLLRYRTGSLKIQETDLPEVVKRASVIRITPQGVYVLEADGVCLYAIRGI
jgi:hypothetical protein